MSLIEDIEREATGLKGSDPPGCKTCTWLRDKEDADQITEAIEAWHRDSLPRQNLWRLLKKHGLTASESSFRRHCVNCAGIVTDRIYRVNT